MRFYRGKYFFEPGLNPHIFALADTAYAAMKFRKENQARCVTLCRAPVA